MISEIRGIFVPIVTPFAFGSQEVCRGMLKSNIQRLNSTPVRGYMPLGSNGEFFMLSEEESLTVIKTVKNEAAKDKLVFAGAGYESQVMTVEFTKKAADLGADAAFVLTPHYFPEQMTQSCLTEYYVRVADLSPIPIIIYQAPAYAAGVTLFPETICRLAGHPNIIGMKDTSSKPTEVYGSGVLHGNDFVILSGTFGSFYQSMESGAVGGVLSCANYIPEISCELYRAILKGDGKAKDMYERLGRLLKITTAPFGVGGVKAAMNLLGYQGGDTRRPLCYPDESQLEKLEKNLIWGLKELGG